MQVLEHLDSFQVRRDVNEPKNVDFMFTFSPNEYLADECLCLRKTIFNLQAPELDCKITSSVVPIKWRPGKDVTRPVKGAPPSFFTWFAFEAEGRDDGLDHVLIAEQLADEIYPHAHK